MPQVQRGRRLSDWLSGYLKLTENTEPPKSYHTWVGISLIAAALRRKVHISWGFETIFPNFYIVLIGPSGRCRKGTAMNVGHDILRELSIPMTAESITREALIRDLRNSFENFIDPDTKEVKIHCSLTCLSPELSVFLGRNDIQFLADLTDWYDCRSSWTYKTKGAGTDEIQGIYFNLLGATAADWLQSVLPAEAIGGGFTSRIIFIVEENKRKTVPLPIYTKEERELREALVYDLERIATMSGEMELSEEVKQHYASWYEQEDMKMRKGKFPIDDERFLGYCERRQTHLRKLAIVMSASRGNDLYIQSDDFERARQVLEAAEIKMARVFSGLGSATHAQLTEKILRYLERYKFVTRSQLLTEFYRDMDIQTLETVEGVLQGMKIIKVQFSPDEKEHFYTYLGGKK